MGSASGTSTMLLRVYIITIDRPHYSRQGNYLHFTSITLRSLVFMFISFLVMIQYLHV